MSKIIVLNLPVKKSGFWMITNILSFFKNLNSSIWVRLEISHIDFDKKKSNNYKFLSRETLKLSIDYLMYVHIGDEFDLSGRKIEFKKRNMKSYFWDIYTEPYHLSPKLYNQDDFIEFGDEFYFTASSNGVQYFELTEYKKLKAKRKVGADKQVEVKNSDKIETLCILPTSVIGQAFYLLESEFNSLLFTSKMKEVLKNYNSNNIVYRENSKIGLFNYEQAVLRNENTIQVLSSFLFSKKEEFIKSLRRLNDENLLSSFNSPDNIPFHFQFPTSVPLKLKIEGSYFKGVDRNIFLARRIVSAEGYFEGFHKLYVVDAIEYMSDVDKGYSGNHVIESHQPRFVTSPTNSSTILDTPYDSSNGSENDFLPSKTGFFNNIKIRKSLIKTNKSVVSAGGALISGSVATGVSLNPMGETSDENNKRLKPHKNKNESAKNNNPKEKNLKKRNFDLVIDEFEKKYLDDIFVNRFSYKESIIVEFNVIGSTKYIYFISAFGKRIQVIYNVSLRKYIKRELMEILDSVENGGGNSWIRWRNKNFTFEGMMFGISINHFEENNYKINDYEHDLIKFYKRIYSCIL